MWTTNKHQCLTEVCKAVNLCWLHSFLETCKTDWFSRGPNEFGSGNVVSDTFVKWLSSNEERKWGQRTGAGVMGDGLAGRKDRRRQQQRVPRPNHHPLRRCIWEAGGMRQQRNYPWRFMGRHAWMASHQGMHGPADQWHTQTPRFEDVLKVGNYIHLGDTCGRHHLCKGSSNNLKAIDDSILCGRCRDRKVGMAEFNCIRDNLAFCVIFDKFEAAERLQSWTNVEAILGTKVPRPSRCWLSMDEDATTNWPKWHLVEVEGP